MNDLGKLAELQASKYLIKKHYKILNYNYRTRFGEIDIIAQHKKFLVFVEVKMRGENTIAEPREFVNYSKQQKLIATAQLYLAYHQTDLQPRFDVIEVFYEKGRIKSIKHLENAFELV